MSTSEKIIFQKTRDFGQKLSATIEFIKQNFKKLLGAILRIVGIPLLIMALIWGGVYFTSLSFLLEGDFNPAILGLLGIGGLLTIILFVIYQALFYGTIYEFILMYMHGDKDDFTISDLAKRVRKNLGEHIVTVLALIGLVIALAVVPTILLVLVIQDSPFVAVTLIFMFMILMVYVFVCLTLFVVIRVHEKIPVAEAISRSFELIKGKWWSTFGLIFVCGLIQSFVSYLVLIPYYVIVFAMGFSGEFDAMSGGVSDAPLGIIIVSVIFYTLYMLFALVMSLLTYIAIAFQYYNLVEMKEAKGLMDRMETFGQITDEDEGHY